MNKETHNLKVLEITVERLIKVYELTNIAEFNNDIQKEIQKEAMKTGEKILFEYANQNSVDLMSLDYKLSHIKAVKNIIEELENEVKKKRKELLKNWRW